MNPIRTTDPRRRRLIRALDRTKRRIWKNVSGFLQKSRTNRIIVNLGKINVFSEGKDIILIPGKVLSSGELTHHVTVAAFAFSKKARKKILKAGGESIIIEDLLKRNPTGSKVKLLT
ncbi:MAG: 50S ribosomal protein L18e [Candidatus Helarchaeota archaeon]|nr:50S ribosomal protein L18e [Candidatus Helarchaeota archaeon]